MRMGIGIGWPNASAGAAILIRDCNGNTANVYLDGEGFVPPTKVYENPELTIPFNSNEGYWNVPELINTIGGYEILSTGEINPGLTACLV